MEEQPTPQSQLRDEIIATLRTCYDPEIPVDIYELGLIYSIEIGTEGAVRIAMTLTSPMCPVAESLPLEVEDKLRALNGVSEVRVEVTWEPPWNSSMMSEAARLELNL